MLPASGRCGGSPAVTWKTCPGNDLGWRQSPRLWLVQRSPWSPSWGYFCWPTRSWQVTRCLDHWSVYPYCSLRYDRRGNGARRFPSRWTRRSLPWAGTDASHGTSVGGLPSCSPRKYGHGSPQLWNRHPVGCSQCSVSWPLQLLNFIDAGHRDRQLQDQC